MKNTILLLFSIIVTSACAQKSDKLDNATALKLLKANYKKSCEGEVVSYFGSYPNNSKLNYYDHYFSELKKKGLVKFVKNKYKNGKVALSIAYTDLATRKYKARPGFSSFQAEVLMFIPTSIIGISHHSGNKADVLFKGNMDETIFYKIKRQNNKCKKEKDIEQKATFIRYDTGWRIE